MKHVTQSQSVRALLLALAVSGLPFIAAHAVAGEAAKPKVMFVTTGGTIAHLKNPDGANSRIELPDVVANIRKRFRNRM